MIKHLSLRTRLALATSLLFLMIVASVDLVVVSCFQSHLRVAIADQQFSFVSQMAMQLDLDIAGARQLLISEAAAITADILAEPAKVKNFIAERRSLLTVFDYGIFLFDRRGRLLADSKGGRAIQRGDDFSALPYIAETIRTGRPYISEPYISAIANYHPVVMFTAPVCDAKQRLIGIFAGGLDLLGENILARPAAIKVGQTGYLAVYTANGVVLSHTDRQRIMASLKNKSLQEARQGKEGTEETADLRGIPVLMSVKRLHSAPWLLAANYPTAELYAPLVRAQRFSYTIAGIGALITVVLIWLLVGYLTKALYLLTAEVSGIGRSPAAGSRVGVETQDEVGKLAGAINAMLEALGRSQQQLQSLASELAITEERERRRIATDLHDSICQTLALANMKLGQIQVAAPDAALALETARRHIEKAVADMRSLIFDLSPPIVYELGLAPALEWLAEQCAKEYGLEVEVSDDGADKPLASEVCIFLFRACRELLLNVVKHAGVRCARVTLTRIDNEVHLRVEDRGKGFDTSRLTIGRDRGEGFGLFSIRERLSYFGGSFRIRSRPGGGTEVALLTPLAPREATAPAETKKEE